MGTSWIIMTEEGKEKERGRKKEQHCQFYQKKISNQTEQLNLHFDPKFWSFFNEMGGLQSRSLNLLNW